MMNHWCAFLCIGIAMFVVAFCCRSSSSGLLFFSTPKCLFLDRAIGPSLFFDLQLFFSPAMRLRKRAQSFFQPLCIILSSLFLGPETSCSEPRIFFRTPKHLFSGPLVLFLTSAGETHTQGEMKSKSQIKN